MSITKKWGDHFRLPPPGNMMQAHENRHRTFVNQGTGIANAIVECLAKYGPDRNISDLTILDFGCGVGRAALPLFFNFRKPDHCVDVDPDAIAYLQQVLPEAKPEVSPFQPPLSFADDMFDVVYAISVWTHLPADSADLWLKEMRRILRPGGLALLTTSNYAVLAQRRAQEKPARESWSDVSDEDLRREGFIFKRTPSTPGTGTYGLASHDPAWILNNWSRYMPVIGIETGGINGTQDVNVLKKPAAVP